MRSTDEMRNNKLGDSEQISHEDMGKSEIDSINKKIHSERDDPTIQMRKQRMQIQDLKDLNSELIQFCQQKEAVINQLQIEQQTLKDNVMKLNQELEASKNKIKELHALDIMKNQIKENAKISIEQDHRKEVVENEKIIAKLEESLLDAQATIEALKKQVTQQQSVDSQISKTIDNFDKKLSVKEKTIKEKNAIIEKLNNSNNDKEKIISALKSENGSFKKSIDKNKRLETENAALKAQIKKLMGESETNKNTTKETEEKIESSALSTETSVLDKPAEQNSNNSGGKENGKDKDSEIVLVDEKKMAMEIFLKHMSNFNHEKSNSDDMDGLYEKTASGILAEISQMKISLDASNDNKISIVMELMFHCCTTCSEAKQGLDIFSSITPFTSSERLLKGYINTENEDRKTIYLKNHIAFYVKYLIENKVHGIMPKNNDANNELATVFIRSFIDFYCLKMGSLSDGHRKMLSDIKDVTSKYQNEILNAFVSNRKDVKVSSTKFTIISGKEKSESNAREVEIVKQFFEILNPVIEDLNEEKKNKSDILNSAMNKIFRLQPESELPVKRMHGTLGLIAGLSDQKLKAELFCHIAPMMCDKKLLAEYKNRNAGKRFSKEILIAVSLLRKKYFSAWVDKNNESKEQLLRSLMFLIRTYYVQCDIESTEMDMLDELYFELNSTIGGNEIYQKIIVASHYIDRLVKTLGKNPIDRNVVINEARMKIAQINLNHSENPLDTYFYMLNISFIDNESIRSRPDWRRELYLGSVSLLSKKFIDEMKEVEKDPQKRAELCYQYLTIALQELKDDPVAQFLLYKGENISGPTYLNRCLKFYSSLGKDASRLCDPNMDIVNELLTHFEGDEKSSSLKVPNKSEKKFSNSLRRS